MNETASSIIASDMVNAVQINVLIVPGSVDLTTNVAD